jgi:hypothetical protein
VIEGVEERKTINGMPECPAKDRKISDPIHIK